MRAELLVYVLALAAPARMHWEELVDLLWPGTGGTGAARRLRTALWDARRALGVEGWRIDRLGDALGADLEGAILDVGVVAASADERGRIIEDLSRRLRRRGVAG
jgi:DNA-binding SARP family transcriptional activator